MQKPEPVLVADRFPALLDALLSLLRGLTEEEWNAPTTAAGWSVKDVAQHLLGDEMNILSGARDHYAGSSEIITSWEDLVALINRNNALWVQATRRLSPRVICDLLRWAGEQANEVFARMDPYETAGTVAWAGVDEAPGWMVMAREFTERWHHQQHIREAVGKPGSTQPFFLQPVLAAFVRALPQTYQKVEAPEGVAVTLEITGPAGGTWTVVREGKGWQLWEGRPDAPTAEVVLPEDVAWRVFTKGMDFEQARQIAELRGDQSLAERALRTISIIA